MTCIVGIIDGKYVYMGGDSFAGTEYNHMRVKYPKVFKREVDIAGSKTPDYMLMGGCGSFRMLQLLRYSLDIPQYDPNVDIGEWFVEIFAEEVRELFKERGLTKLIDESEELFNGEFLIGFRGNLFTLQEDYACIAFAEKEHCSGAGEEYALGGLFGTKGRVKNINERINIALGAAAEFSPAVLAPFHIVSTEPEPKLK